MLMNRKIYAAKCKNHKLVNTDRKLFAKGIYFNKYMNSKFVEKS